MIQIDYPKRGDAVFIIRISGDRTQVRTIATEGEPETILNAAIRALEHEKAELIKCPFHQRKPK